MLKVTGSHTNVTGPKCFLLIKTLFFLIHRITSRRMRVWPLFILPLMIYFHAFSRYSVGQTMLLQESFDNITSSGFVEAAGATGNVLRTTGDATACVSSYS